VLLEYIERNHHNLIIRRCSEKGCRLRVDNLGNHVIIKGERLYRQCKICDCIVITEENKIALVELKGKTAHVNQIFEKLENCAEAASTLVVENNQNPRDFKLCFVVLCKNWRVSEYRLITGHRIRHQGKKYDIYAKKSGTSLIGLLP
jgi:hypothetical protein